jgi:hypothetical protein
MSEELTEERQATDRSQLPPSLQDKSQEDWERLGGLTNKLIKKNPRIAKAYFSMIAAIRLYNTALAAITDECLQAELGEASEGVAFILKNSVREATGKEFARTTLQSHVQQHVLEFLAMELALEKEQERAEELRDESAAAAARRTERLFVGRKLCCGDDDTISRDRTVLLVGAENAIGRLLAGIQGVCESHGTTVGHLLAYMRQNTDVTRKNNTDQLYFALGVNYWVNSAASRRKFTELLNKLRHRMKRNCVDLLFVDDLSQAQEAGSSLPVALRAHGAERTIRRCADETGMAVIAGLPCDDVNPADRDWDKLEVYTDLRFVSISENRDIVIKNRDGKSWDIYPHITSGEPA